MSPPPDLRHDFSNFFNATSSPFCRSSCLILRASLTRLSFVLGMFLAAPLLKLLVILAQILKKIQIINHCSKITRKIQQASSENQKKMTEFDFVK